MRCINRIELLDRIRQDLISQGRETEAEDIDHETTKEGLCILLGLPPETTTWEDLREKYGLTFRGGHRDVGGPAVPCYLVDVLTGESTHFSSYTKLGVYLECSPRRSLSRDDISSVIRQGGCIITHRGRDKYLVPNLDVDFSSLSRCKVKSLVVRLEAQHQLGLPVDTYSTCRSILGKVPVVGDIRNGYKRVLYDYFGRGEEYEKSHEGGYKAPSVTILYSPDNVHIFMSRMAASRFLKISEMTLEFLAGSAIPCPYKGVYYRIEL